MRVAFLVHEFPSVSETFVLDQLTGLLDRGVSVDVFGEAPGQAGPRPAVESRGLTARLRPFHAPRSYARRTVAATRLLAAGPRRRTLLRTLDVFSYGRQSASLQLLFQAHALLGEAPYDVVHAHFGPNGADAAALRELGALSAPLVTSFYGYDLSRHVKSRGTTVYDRLARTGDLFLALSLTMRDELIALGFPPERVVVHRLGVDVAAISARRRARVPRVGPKRVVSIARLVEKKGIAHALRAVGALATKGHDVVYTVIGEGPERPGLEALVHELGLSGRVTLAGARTRSETLDALAAADVLLAPSVTARDGDREGTPVAILEAHAMSIPVVATRHAGIPEIVADGGSGLLVDEGSATALADALESLLLEPALGEPLGRAGHALVASRHDIGPLNDSLVELYRSLT